METPKRLTVQILKQARDDMPGKISLSNNDIFKYAVVGKTAGYDLLKPIDPRRVGKYRPGRPHKLSKADIQKVEDWIEDEGWYARVCTYEEIVKELDLSCYWKTLKKELHTHRWFKFKAVKKKALNPKQAMDRRVWCSEKSSLTPRRRLGRRLDATCRR